MRPGIDDAQSIAWRLIEMAAPTNFKQEVRDLIQEKMPDRFTSKDVKMHFSDRKRKSIDNALFALKQEGFIGKYDRNIYTKKGVEVSVSPKPAPKHDSNIMEVVGRTQSQKLVLRDEDGIIFIAEEL
jgi:hypothetical protein